MSRRGGGGRGGSKSALTASKELLKRSASEAGLDDRHIKVLSDITRPPLFPDFLWKSTGHNWNDDPGTTLTTVNSIDRQQQHPAIKTEGTPSTTTTSIKKLPSSMISRISKQRELTKRFQNSSYHIRPNNVIDILRYSDRKDNIRNQNSSADETVLASLCASVDNTNTGINRSNNNNVHPNLLAADTNYFPAELLSRNKAKTGRRKQHHTNLVHVPTTEKLIGSSTGRTMNYATTSASAVAVAIKLETLDHQEKEEASGGGKIRTTSITSITSNDDLMLTVPPALYSSRTNVKRKSSEADETILGDIDDVDDDDDDNVDILEETVEEELGEDYTTNYYASDDDNNDDDGDNDGEPTY